MHARGLLTSIMSWGLHKLMSLSIHLCDLTPDELAGRDAVDDLLDAYMSNHATREPSPQQETQARDIPVDLTKIMARDAVDDLLDAYMSNHATREPQQEARARNIPVDPTKIVARDDRSTNAFIKALLNSRDSSKRELTADDVLSLTSLASRALDELD